MRKSILFRRIVALLLCAVLLSGVLSAGIYIAAARRIYADMRAKELLPVARTIADMTGAGEIVNMRPGQKFGADLMIFNEMGEPARNGPFGDRRQIHGEVPPGDIQAALTGKEVSHIVDRSLIVGVPIETGGAVFLTKPVSEVSDTQNLLNLILMISTLASFCIMLVPGYFAARQLVVPIRRMRGVARAMAKGDFTMRADDTQKDELGELGRAMNRFAEESGKLEQTRQGYVANVSHELRTPVAAIRAMGETLRDGMAKTPEKQSLFYNNIVRESMRLSRLIDDLLELSRLQSGAEAMQKKRFDLSEAIRNTAELYGHMAADAGLKFAPPADLEKPAPVFCSPDRIEQVLVILLDNTIKHTPEGGEISLSYTDKGKYLEVCVANTGICIPGEDLPHIFERFYKADKSRSGEGFGLGLSIAKEIMGQLGEDISAESDERSTKFVFSVSK